VLCCCVCPCVWFLVVNTYSNISSGRVCVCGHRRTNTSKRVKHKSYYMRVQSWQKGMKEKKRASYLAFGLSSAGARGLHGKSFFKNLHKPSLEKSHSRFSPSGEERRDEKGREKKKNRRGRTTICIQMRNTDFYSYRMRTHTHTKRQTTWGSSF
jgi:hypothetical protein